MEELKCPADILYEKEWRSAYGNRCNAIFLSDVMNDHESMRKLFHSDGDTHSMSPLVGIFYDYYKDHDKEKMLNRVKEVTTGRDGYQAFGQPFSVEEYEGKRVLWDWSCKHTFCVANKESPWADLKNYEKRATVNIRDDFNSRQSVYYDNKSVAEVLKDTAEKTTFLEKKIEEPTKNEQLDLLVKNLIQHHDEKQIGRAHV